MVTGNLTLYAILGGVVLILAVGAIYAAWQRPVYRRRGQLLLLNEQRFMAALMQVVPPGMLLTFKVRLLDIVSITNARNGRNMDKLLGDYNVDFVLVDRETTDIRLCIEMDMESATAAQRIARNTLVSRALRRAGIAHLRMPLVRYYDPARLRDVIQEAIANAPKPDKTQAETPASRVAAPAGLTAQTSR